MTPYEWVFSLIVATFIVASILIVTAICAIGIAFIIGFIEKRHH